jgi:hypothetical protein
MWRAFGLQPHRESTFKISEDPQFVDEVRDVVGLSMSPPDHALVRCVDDKSQVQALDRSPPLLPLQPGSPERRTHDYHRRGTTSLLAGSTGSSDSAPRSRRGEFNRNRSPGRPRQTCSTVC